MLKLGSFKNKLENSKYKVLELEISNKVGISNTFIKVRNSNSKVRKSKTITGFS